MQELERIVKLETEVVQMKEIQAKILENQEEMKDQLTKYKGFIGGVMFIGSCTMALLGLIAKKIGWGS
jgi:hypothetical protein